MNIYVETNFVLELVFEQEQYGSCEQILELCEEDLAKLIIPAYSLAEPHEKLNRQAKKRKELQQSLDGELRQLSRTRSYQSRINDIRAINILIVQSNEEEKQRFGRYRDRLLDIAEFVALTDDIIKEAGNYENTYDLSPQDAFVHASVISHLRRCKLQAKEEKLQESCFLNRNSKDFKIPDIKQELEQFNCKIISSFDKGLDFLHSRLNLPS